MNLSPNEMAALTAAICVSPHNHGDEMCLGLPGRIGQHFPDEAVEPQLDARGRLFCVLHVG
jgi:hypothetical protein